MFVLLMLFLFKYIDDLIGKGFEWYTILQLMMYASATNVAMALPLSVLLSSIMTYGALGENYELVAIKSAGISLSRALYPMVIVVFFLSVAAFFFSEYMLPVANLKYYSLLYDARKQKASFLISEGIFNNSIPGYSIRVKHKDKDGATLHDLMIYSRASLQDNNMAVTFAKEGVMFRAGDNLIIRLRDGVRYEESAGRNNASDQRQTLQRIRFKERIQKFDLSSFNLQRTNEDEFRGAFQMMNLKQLNGFRDSSNKLVNLGLERNFLLITPYMKYFQFPHKSKTVKKYLPGDLNYLKKQPRDAQLASMNNALNEAKSVGEQVKLRATRFEELNHEVRRSRVEYEKKFTLSAACIALFLIGAPLGAIIRKGGLGLPVVVSIIFFLIYYIISTIGEKSVKDGDWTPLFGMWMPIGVLTPIGLFLSYKAANDSTLFDIELYKRFFKNIGSIFKRKALPQ